MAFSLFFPFLWNPVVEKHAVNSSFISLYSDYFHHFNRCKQIRPVWVCVRQNTAVVRLLVCVEKVRVVDVCMHICGVLVQSHCTFVCVTRSVRALVICVCVFVPMFGQQV